ncbi:MAG TPA: hypothetical protein PKE40_01160 [Arachnia sp.]|nr:hypothetical protein [Arachnia sp.]HMT84936.1 hypothetical protein [Arachnia sp.]
MRVGDILGPPDAPATLPLDGRPVRAGYLDVRTGRPLPFLPYLIDPHPVDAVEAQP